MSNLGLLIAEFERAGMDAVAKSIRLMDSGDTRDGSYQEGRADALDWVLGKLHALAAVEATP